MIRSLCIGILLFFCYLPLPSAQAADFSQMAQIRSVRVHADAKKVRVVVDAAHEVDYETHVLANPQRIVVDLTGAWVGPQVKKEIAVSSPFVKKIRVAQFNKKTVRVVVETAVSRKDYDVFSLSGGAAPYRVVMDFGSLQQTTQEKTTKVPDQGGKKPVTTVPKTTPVQQPGTTETSTEAPAKEVHFTPGIRGKKIALDAGHGGSDTGAIGPTGVTEKSITLRVAQEVKRQLTAAGAQVFMTREGDTEVSSKGAEASDVEELQARCDVANDHGADIFLSIHMDSFTSNDAHGTTGYYYSKGSLTSQRLADAVRSGVIDQIATESRGTKSCNFYVVKHTTMPSSLLEVAFVSNAAEEKLMDSDEGIKKAASGIVAGLRKFFG